MHYKAAYLYLFNILTDIIKLLESSDTNLESVAVVELLRSVQAQAEQKCTK